jgi:hypothetical protein
MNSVTAWGLALVSAAAMLVGSCRTVPAPAFEQSDGARTARLAGLERAAIALEDTAGTAANVMMGDIDGDGDLDVVIARGRHWPVPNLLLFNNGTGAFRPESIPGPGDRTYAAALADLDMDGDLDLVVGNDAPDSKRILFNDGRGHFTDGGTFGMPTWATRNLVVADLNGDRYPDIVVANRGGRENISANYICLNDTRGSFPACTILSRESATTIAAADLDGDGDIDLVVPHRDGGQSYFFLNDGNGGFEDRRAYGPAISATRAIAVADVDGDGLPDIISGDETRSGTWLFVNRGSYVFSEGMPIGDPHDNPFVLVVADLYGDGKPEIILGNSGTPGAVLSFLGSGQISVRRFGDGAGLMYGIAVGDLTGDGVVDIAVARSDAPSMLYVR